MRVDIYYKLNRFSFVLKTNRWYNFYSGKEFMTLTLCVFAATATLMIYSVLFKPYITVGKFHVGLYWLITLVGATAVLIAGLLPFSFAIEKITADTAVNPLKILALFLSVSLLSLFLGNAGFFDRIAEKVFEKTENGGIKLFIVLFAVVSILTVFTSNDIVILTFTPPICIFCKKAKISPVPYLFGEFVAANTWSMMLVIGNPTNVYLAESAGIGFFSYLSVMALPAVLSGTVSLGALLIIFKKRLTAANRTTDSVSVKGNTRTVEYNKFLTVLSLAHLGACLILLAAAEFIGVQSYLVCVLSAASLTIFYSAYCFFKEKSLKRILKVFGGAPYELIPFVISMFVMVSSLYYCGFTEKLSELFITGKSIDGVSFGFLSAACANIFNNIPMSVLFEKIIAGKSAAALYGAVIGSNIGAFITPVGALAGIMWNKILSGYGVKFPFWKFFGYGCLIAIPALTAATFALLICV